MNLYRLAPAKLDAVTAQGRYQSQMFQGSRVKLTTRMPVNGNRHFEGRLEHFESGRLTLDLSGARRKHRAAEDAPQKLELELVNVEKANLVPEL